MGKPRALSGWADNRYSRSLLVLGMLLALTAVLTVCIVPGRLANWLGMAAFSLCDALGEGVVPSYIYPHDAEKSGDSLAFSWSGRSEAQGSSFVPFKDKGVLVVVDGNVILSSALEDNFYALNWSYAWINFAEQEYGHYEVADLASSETRFKRGCLDRYALVIITRSVAGRPLLQDWNSIFEDYLERGGKMLVELPCRYWSYLTGVVLSSQDLNNCGRSRRGTPLLFGNMGSGWEELETSPVYTRLRENLDVHSGVQSRGTILDRPILWKHRLGQGLVCTLGFDFALQLQAMQQGVPSGPAWNVGERSGLAPGLSESQGLACDNQMLDNTVPYADLLEAWLFAELEHGEAGVPVWWRFPYQYDGVLAVTHDEEGLGAESMREVLALDSELGVAPQIYIISSRDLPERWGSARAVCPGERVGLHWNRFAPFVTLSGQLDLWRRTLGEPSDIMASRLHYLAWGDDYARPFRAMAAQGITLDSSYGPNRGRGYLFGTGLPFRAIDSNGRPLPVWEMPLLTQENWYGVDSSFVNSLLCGSVRSHHQSISLLLHHHRWLASEEGRAFLREVVADARQRRHWTVAQQDYLDFWLRRSQLPCAFRMTRSGSKLTLQVFADAPREGMALSLPDCWQNMHLDGKPVGETRWVCQGGLKRQLVAFPLGAHILTAVLDDMEGLELR